MKLLSMKLYSALFALAVLLPVSHAHAWGWRDLWPTQSVAASAQKEVAHVAQKTNVMQSALRSASGAADLGENIIGHTGSLVWNHPKLTAAALVGGYAYAKRHDIADWCGKRFEEYKPYLKTAGGIVGMAATAMAAKKLYDLLPNVASNNSMPVATQKVLVPQVVAPQASLPAPVKSDNISDDTYGKLWDLFEAERKAAAEKIQSVSQVLQTKSDDVLPPVMDNAISVQEQKNKTDVAFNVHEAVWQEIAHNSVRATTIKNDESIKLPKIDTKTIQNRIAVFESGFQPRVHHHLFDEASFIMNTDEADSKNKEVNKWVAEFNKPEKTEWVKEFKAEQKQEKQEAKLAGLTDKEPLELIEPGKGRLYLSAPSMERIQMLARQLMPNRMLPDDYGK